ncbi:hypothetical protein EV182_005815 [Spiromyces aspiralis]|uniref:Uncharacterized protein n=1 Tax=Spiromyces aspiralis TaxID=68401 RepID=A0ACC1HM32_9FUNG|nr:hypothetical protein EV182_005815 [Spiromyces aspiralis]
MRSSARNDPSLVTTSITKMAAPSDGLDLPYYTKFLLISGFLASYNPTKMDVQYFARTKGDGGFGIKRRGRKPKAKEAMANGMDRQQLLGPKAFPIERMLAIFYSILDNPVDCTVNVYSQVASLITLRLLVRTTPMDKLETMRCRCNVSYDFIRQVSQSVMFDIDRYLYNFV